MFGHTAQIAQASHGFSRRLPTLTNGLSNLSMLPMEVSQRLLHLVEVFAFDDYIRAAVYTDVGTYFQCLGNEGVHIEDGVSYETGRA